MLNLQKRPILCLEGGVESWAGAGVVAIEDVVGVMGGVVDSELCVIVDSAGEFVVAFVVGVMTDLVDEICTSFLVDLVVNLMGELLER